MTDLPCLVAVPPLSADPGALVNGRRGSWRLAPAPGGDAGYSGKWQMRAPRSLHRRLAERAAAEGVSLNTLATTLMAEGLGERRATRRGAR